MKAFTVDSKYPTADTNVNMSLTYRADRTVWPDGLLSEKIYGTSAPTLIAFGRGYLSLTGINGIAESLCNAIGNARLEGSILGSSLSDLLLYGNARLLGSIAGFATVTGAIDRKGQLIGTSQGVASLTGILIGHGWIYGISEGGCIVELPSHAVARLLGSSEGTTTIEEHLQGIARLAGFSDGIATTEGAVQAKDYIQHRICIYGWVREIELTENAALCHEK